jgi:hypothetical protein
LKIKYSPLFARDFAKLPASVQSQFKCIDTQVAKGNLDSFDRQGWAYFVNVNDNCAAMGCLKEDGKLFYWNLIGSPATMPDIL